MVLRGGVIVEAWTSGFVDGVFDPPFTTSTRMITRVTEVRTGALADRDCAGQPSGCAAVLNLEQLLLVGPDGPIPGQRTAEGLSDPLTGDVLPDGWVVLTESGVVVYKVVREYQPLSEAVGGFPAHTCMSS